ncbi:MAG: nitrous oxide reductase accessory protein NosL [Leptospiraceae bacterium]|nr:nitrous oxide reductase accessory protein NosL [Leptospiraceae bacterium]
MKLPKLCFTIFFILLNCSPGKPIPIKKGEYKCEHCNMSIVDLRFNSQAITSKGKIFHFDSAECLIYWREKIHQSNDISSYFKNFIHPDQYIALQQAIFLQSETLKSPMGEGISVFSSKEEAKEIRDKFNGELKSYEELKELLLKKWKK